MKNAGNGNLLGGLTFYDDASILWSVLKKPGEIFQCHHDHFVTAERLPPFLTNIHQTLPRKHDKGIRVMGNIYPYISSIVWALLW